MPNSPYPQSDRDLIRFIERSPSHRAGYKQLIRELGLGGGRERRLLLEQLARITLRGDLVKIDDGQWALPRATPDKTERPGAPRPDSGTWDRGTRPHGRITRENLVAGKLDLHRDGFGFVRPNGSSKREDDLFIPPHELNGAMQGDEVLVDEAPPAVDGRRSGRIARILTRRNTTVVGIFHYARGRGSRGTTPDSYNTANFHYIVPLDERMTQPILIESAPDGQPTLPATPAESQHRVLGEEARRELSFDPSLPHFLEGLAVDVEVTSFPTESRPAQGRILEILGHPDAFGVDVEIVIRKHHLPYAFPANVLAEAAASADQTVDTLTPEDLSLRHDFRGLPIVTIDGETARDFDDAILVQPLPNGNWQLQVHIADVSHYVRPGTDLDLEARLRGTSVYFPDRSVPMLPPSLSSNMCSLRPDEDRLVLSCIAEIDNHGEVVDYQLCEGIIRSARRMTYTQVQSILDTSSTTPPPGAPRPDSGTWVSAYLSTDLSPAESEKHTRDLETRLQFLDLAPAFEQMYDLALKLNRKRHRRGSIDFDLPEPVIRFDPQGNMAAITRSERGWANRLIEEFMLTANECVAHWLEALGPSIYRIHELPDAKRILDFEEVAATYGQTLGFSSLPVKKLTMKSDRRSNRAASERHGGRTRQAQSHEIPESIPVTPLMYQKLTAKIAGTPEERILSYLMLRSLKQARYSEKNEGHFALASPSYTHFTSPIRRYPDLIVHRLIRAALHANANPNGQPIFSTDPQPWSSKRSSTKPGAPRLASETWVSTTLPPEELAAISLESSQSERRADDAERELMEWKKIKFMQDRVGEEFHATVLSCTKYGFYVELDDLFIEGMVPIQSLSESLPFGDPDRFFFRDTDRVIVASHSGRVFKLGQRVHVLLDRIDRPNRRLQFALVPSRTPQGESPRSLRKPKATPARRETFSSPTRTGKPSRTKTKSKTRLRDKKAKGKGKRH
ncbi:ribonuclease R family protein [Granulicella tundricola]|uniref:Ribonuclease R n=1 Tax=Granulicella tundricola (strain ATCC BAA-1859 / DSM 23138 / MP5ACTX9) TaxID=1198114 RepID=E8X3E5_GRATM|nr:RNB domain-containing ribonuclease [Granulicella tundricola]ADW70446.1 ribonuclease R [Granulicella tundricola MP5ACTX9]